MAVPVWVPGQVLASADVDTWFVPLAAVKAGDESATSNTTLHNDLDLHVPVAASSTYEFSCYLFFQAFAGGDIKWTWTGPAGIVLVYDALHNEGGGTLLNASATTYGLASAGTAAGGGAGVNEALVMRGTCIVSGTAGSLQLQWAQQTSSGTATIVKAGSHLVLRRIA
jgi:hypothetical protein